MSDQARPDMRAAALALISRGFPVFPLCWPNGSNNVCGCGRNHQGRDIGKVPLTEHGLRDATLLQLRVTEYWTQYPRANIGVAIPQSHFVLDVDADHGGYDSLETMQKDHAKLPDTLTGLTGGNGSHLWFIAPAIRNTVALAGYSGLDIRGGGGYVVAPPSLHRSGEEYAWISESPIAEAPDWLIELCTKKRSAAPSSTPEGEPIPESQRNHTLASLAGTMRRRGMPESAIEAALLEVNRRQCQPPLTDDEVRKIAASVSRYPPAPPTGINTLYNYCPLDTEPGTERHKSGTESVTKEGGKGTSVTKSMAEVIEDWVKDTSGWFSYEELDKELGIKTESDKHNRRMIVKRLRDSGTIEAHPKSNKLFRFVNVAVRLIDFKSGGTRTPLAIRYPFGIERYFKTYPGNIIALAGDADAGKTAWLLNLIRLNQDDFSIFYQSSEMGKEELASRLQNFEGIALEDWNFIAEERSKDFQDVIRPDCINVIDYMELCGDFYNIAEYLRAIHDKLASGICVVALQKKRGADTGRGGDFGLEKPRLYLSMDAGKCTIRKAKNWVDPTFNPNGRVIKYKIVGGCKFIITEGWQKPEGGNQ